jgi:hypothetical protein
MAVVVIMIASALRRHSNDQKHNRNGCHGNREQVVAGVNVETQSPLSAQPQ